MLIDYDIGTPVPAAPEAIFGDFDWFHTMVRFGRLISKAYEFLFSVSAVSSSKSSCRAAVATVFEELERWKNSLPKPVRPGYPFQPTYFPDDASMAVALRTRYHYYSVIIALSRISLYLDSEEFPHRQSEHTAGLMNAARAAIELTRYIEAEPYTPVW